MCLCKRALDKINVAINQCRSVNASYLSALLALSLQLILFKENLMRV